MAASSPLTCHALRLHPGQDLHAALFQYVKDHNLQAAFVMTCCGSVTSARLRMAHDGGAGTNAVRLLTGHYEIVSLVGTVCGDADHLHISLSDKDGGVIGGHVLGDVTMFTTAEVVIGELTALRFSRPHDPDTGFPELAVESRTA